VSGLGGKLPECLGGVVGSGIVFCILDYVVFVPEHNCPRGGSKSGE
jgi:hypothetical protein